MANNGPTFTKATYDDERSNYQVPSPARAQAQLEQEMRDAADEKLFRTDTKAWLQKHGLVKG